MSGTFLFQEVLTGVSCLSPPSTFSGSKARAGHSPRAFFFAFRGGFSFCGGARGGAESVAGRASCGRSRFAGLLFGTGPAQVAAQLALRAQTCSPSPCQRQGANLGRPACLRRPHRRPASHRLGFFAPLVPRHGRGLVARHKRGAKGWGDGRPGALWGLRSGASRWARAARIVDKLAGVV